MEIEKAPIRRQAERAIFHPEALPKDLVESTRGSRDPIRVSVIPLKRGLVFGL
jgi:hypothetical protein